MDPKDTPKPPTSIPSDSESLGNNLETLFQEAVAQEKGAPAKDNPAEKQAEAAKAPAVADAADDFDPDAAKPAVAAPATDDEELPDDIKDKSEKTRNSFKEMRREKREAAERAAAAEKRLHDLEAAAPKEDVAAIKARLAEYEQQLQIVAVERDPKFRSYFDGKTKTLIERAKSVAGEKIASILQLPESEYKTKLLDEAIVELSPTRQAMVGAMLNDYETINAERTAELSRASETYKAIQARHQEHQRAAQEASAKLFDENLNRWRSTSPLLKRVDGDKEHNASADKIEADARAIFNGEGDARQMAKHAIYAAHAPHLTKMLKARDVTISELRKEIEELRGAKPNIGDGGGANLGDIDPFAGKTLTDTVLEQAFGR